MEPKQKLHTIDINNNTQESLQGYLDLGYIIHHLVVLETIGKLLIVYIEPQIEEV